MKFKCPNCNGIFNYLLKDLAKFNIIRKNGQVISIKSVCLWKKGEGNVIMKRVNKKNRLNKGGGLINGDRL